MPSSFSGRTLREKMFKTFLLLSGSAFITLVGIILLLPPPWLLAPTNLLLLVSS